MEITGPAAATRFLVTMYFPSTPSDGAGDEDWYAAFGAEHRQAREQSHTQGERPDQALTHRRSSFFS